MAQDSVHGLAPADEYFGRFNLSVLGIANTIRDAGARMDSGTDPRSMLSGPLSFVTDAVQGLEQKYPSDPWIAKDLLALEIVYLRVPGDDGFRLASQTASWLIADYPKTPYAVKASRAACAPSSRQHRGGGRSGAASERRPSVPTRRPGSASPLPRTAAAALKSYA